MFEFLKNKKEQDENKKIDSGLKSSLAKTAKSLIGNIVDIVSKNEKIDEFLLEEIEENLIKSDLGVDLSSSIVEEIRKSKDKISANEIKKVLKKKFIEILEKAGKNNLNFEKGALNIYFITGVNGVGKTTLIGKLANRFKKEGCKVLIAACDTFRAAASEQLEIWAKRADVQIVTKQNFDPASVAYEAIQKAKDENFDVLIIDTAGRLQNKTNLMAELSKIKNVIEKNAPGSLKESMLVLDATTGQNGLNQAQFFLESAGLTSIALTKLDSCAKGAVVILIAEKFNLPVKLVGVGEKISDLKNFETQDFIDALFE